MTDKAGDVSIGDSQSFWILCEKMTALQQMGKKDSGFTVMSQSTDVLPVYQVGGQIVKKHIGSLKSQGKGTVISF